jgi:endo-1,3(4)-beta-glucanase
MTLKEKPMRIRVAILLAILIVVFGGYLHHRKGNTNNQPAVSQAATTKLPRRSPSIPHMNLMKGLLPPTNKWFSSLVFSSQNQPVYAYPLSFAPTIDGYSISNPPVVSSSQAIFATHIADVSVTLGTTAHSVQAYDDLSVEVAQQNADGQTIASTRITHGSPYVFTKLHRSAVISITASGSITPINAHEYTMNVGGRLYGLYTNAQASIKNQSIEISGQQGSLISLFTYPNASLASQYFNEAPHMITGSNVAYQTSSSEITTTYRLDTTGGSSLFASTPAMHITGHSTAGSFKTLLGNQEVLVGTSFTDVQATPHMPSPQLPLKNITASQRASLIQKLSADTNSLTFTQTDTYFGGKELYRAANLLELAEELNQPQLASTIKTKLAARLSQWLDPNGYTERSNLYFYYDTSYDGVVGVQASYGSDSFNDHDFHYGYFIYASAILSQYDPAFYKANAPMVNVLISDIASTQQTSLFPKLRYFDSYVGHSWASGNGDFADGNNQESSSEAINAWYGMYLWSQVSHNKPLAGESEWLYAHETKAAQTMWLSVSNPASTGPAYIHPTAGILWGDKIDYSTFFSPRPQALLGIQLIPMSPGQVYLDQTNVDKNIASVAPTQDDLNGQFQDYLIMYQAFTNPQLALSEAANVNPETLDNANSQTYFYAWLYSRIVK